MKTLTVDGKVYEVVDEWGRNEINRVSMKVDRTLAGAIVRSAQGENIVVSDSSDAYLRNLKVFGKTTQVVTTGAQLFDFAKVMATSTNVAVTGDAESFNVKCTDTIAYASAVIKDIKLPAGTFYIKGNVQITDGLFYLVLRYSNDGGATYPSAASDYLESIESSGDFIKKFTLAEETYVKINFYLNKGTETTGDITLNNVMLSKNQNAEWEPYTGGMPAPSPDYPQELVSVGDGGSVDVGVYGGNLFSTYSLDETVNNVTIKKQSDGSIYFSGTASAHIYKIIGLVTLKKGIYFLSGCPAGGSNNTYQLYAQTKTTGAFRGGDTGNGLRITVTDECETLEIMMAVYKGITVNFKVNPMLNYGTEALLYSPYTEQSLTLSTPNGLPGIPVTDASLATYTDADGQMWCCDEVDLERGVYVQRIGRMNTANITAVYESSVANSNGNVFIITFAAKGVAVLMETRKNAGTAAAHAININEISCGRNNNYSNNITISFVSTTATTAVEALAEIQAEASNIYYILNDPIETALSDEEIAAYKSLHSNYPNTTVLNDAGAEMEVQYNADTNEYIKQNYVPLSSYTALAERVAALEQNALS